MKDWKIDIQVSGFFFFFQINGDAIYELENIRKGPDFGGKMMSPAGLCAFKMP